jgi:hypothetical protein
LATILGEEELKTYDEIPKNATIREEYIKENGPYLYAYWKENKKLRKKYIGKSWNDYYHKLSIKAMSDATGGWDHTIRQFNKYEFISQQAKNGLCRKLAKEYCEKLEQSPKKVSIDWAYKQLKQRVSEVRLWKAIHIAKKENFVYDSPAELMGFIQKDMERLELDPTNMEVLDSYLKRRV